MSTISNKTITQTVTLGTVDSYPTYASPLTIAASGAIKVTSGDAIYGNSVASFTLSNYGTIMASTANGVDLVAVGDFVTITNSGFAPTLSGGHRWLPRFLASK